MSYIRNATIGGDTPYVYVTRRTYDRPEGTVTLTCMGGPEYPIDPSTYDPGEPVPRRDARAHGRRGPAVRPARRGRPACRTTSSGTG